MCIAIKLTIYNVPDAYQEFLQHYDGDVEDLCLTFSWDEDFMGKVYSKLSQHLFPSKEMLTVSYRFTVNSLIATFYIVLFCGLKSKKHVLQVVL